MSELDQLQCSELPADIDVLKADEIAVLLPQLSPLWQHNTESRTISHRYAFKDFYQTMAFVNVIAQIAHQQDHHPDLHLSYNSCNVAYSTHSAGGLSKKDFICAAKINAALTL